jgi:hypothetical protein
MRFRRALRGGRKLSACLSPLVYMFAAALPTFSFAQQPAVQATGQITGTVTDSDGAIVTGATIALEIPRYRLLQLRSTVSRDVPRHHQRKGVCGMDIN